MNHFVIKDIIPKAPGPGVEMRVIHGEKMTMSFSGWNRGQARPSTLTLTSRSERS